MIDGDRKPVPATLSAWIGPANYKRWKHLVGFIDKNYPGVFEPEWLFGGKNYGWGLRFKKSRSFCTLIPERNRFLILIVFGRAEREKAEGMLGDLNFAVREAYKHAPTYHDGKWLFLPVDDETMLTSVHRLLKVKRAPKRT
jgi:hypothetical protein